MPKPSQTENPSSYAIVGRFEGDEKKTELIAQADLNPGEGAIFSVDGEVLFVAQDEFAQRVLSELQRGTLEVATVIDVSTNLLFFTLQAREDQSLGFQVGDPVYPLLVKHENEPGKLIRYMVIFRATKQEAQETLRDLQAQRRLLQ